jgi:hypothetical protein
MNLETTKASAAAAAMVQLALFTRHEDDEAAKRDLCAECGTWHRPAERWERLRSLRRGFEMTPDDVRERLGDCMWPRTTAGDRALFRDLAEVFGPASARRSFGTAHGSSGCELDEPAMATPRDWMVEPDGYREVRCPLLAGDIIAAGRCVASQEQGCRCPASVRALQGLLLARAPDIGTENNCAALTDLERIVELAVVQDACEVAKAARRLTARAPKTPATWRGGGQREVMEALLLRRAKFSAAHESVTQ